MHPDQARTTPLDPGDPHGRGVAARPDRATERKLWFSIIAPPAAWTIAEIVGAAIVGRTCGPSTLSGEMDTWQWIAALAVPVAGAAVALAGLLVAMAVFRRWRTSGTSITGAEGWNRVEFMAMAGAIIGGFLLLNIIFFAVMPLIVDPCMRTT